MKKLNKSRPSLLICLILLDSLSACGGSVEATPDAGTVAPPTKPDASVDWLPPSEHWIQIELAFINACLLSDKGNLRYFGEDQYSSPLSFNEGAFKGLSASTTGEMFAAWTKNHVNFFGNTELYQSPTNWLEPPSGNIEKLIPLSQEGYCYFSEPLPSVPHCNIGSDLGFPTDVKFIDVAGRWNAIPRTAGDRALLLGITAEGKLWCTRHGDDCHAAFGLKPEEKVKKIVDDWACIITEDGRALLRNDTFCENDCGDLQEEFQGEKLTNVVKAGRGLVGLREDGTLVTDSTSAEYWPDQKFYRTDTREEEDIFKLKFRDIDGNGPLCGILESGFVNCWVNELSTVFPVPPDDVRAPIPSY